MPLLSLSYTFSNQCDLQVLQQENEQEGKQEEEEEDDDDDEEEEEEEVEEWRREPEEKSLGVAINETWRWGSWTCRFRLHGHVNGIGLQRRVLFKSYNLLANTHL